MRRKKFLFPMSLNPPQNEKMSAEYFERAMATAHPSITAVDNDNSADKWIQGSAETP
ncbi:MAG: hypothetical protein KDJ32_03110 [Alphaproteobacteria bacterium]|nr:hypothetical protein [Alphaproteobacteria bacterium]